MERVRIDALSPGDVNGHLEKTKLDTPSPGDSSADVVVVCREDVYRLHIALLASKAGFFEAALNAPMVEREEGKIHIREMESEIFKNVVKFMYEQDLEFNLEKELGGLLYAADHFDFEELKIKINEVAKDSLDEANVVTAASLAKRYNTKELLASCVEAMARLKVSCEDWDWEAKADMEEEVACKGRVLQLKRMGERLLPLVR